MDLIFKEKTVLIAEGNAGVGLECATLFHKFGADVILVHRELVKPEKIILENFDPKEISRIKVFEVDLDKPKKIRSSLEEIHKTFANIDILISNYSETQVQDHIDIFDENVFVNDIKASAWPHIELLIGIREVFDSCPNYAVAVLEESSQGAVNNISKSIIETLSRYMATNYLYENCRVNILKVLKDPNKNNIQNGNSDLSFEVSDMDAAKTVITMCSGMLDSMSGQILRLDNGMECASS